MQLRKELRNGFTLLGADLASLFVHAHNLENMLISCLHKADHIVLFTHKSFVYCHGQCLWQHPFIVALHTGYRQNWNYPYKFRQIALRLELQIPDSDMCGCDYVSICQLQASLNIDFSFFWGNASRFIHNVPVSKAWQMKMEQVAALMHNCQCTTSLELHIHSGSSF